MSVCLSNIKLRVCVVKSMCGQEYVWTDQHTVKMKQPNMKFRVYSIWLNIFVPSSMLKSLCLILFDNLIFFWQTDRLTKKAIVEAPPPELKNCKIASEQQSFSIQLIAFVCTIGDDNFFLHRCKWQNACNRAIYIFFKWYFNCYLILALLHLAIILFTLAVVNFCMHHLVVNFCMHY